MLPAGSRLRHRADFSAVTRSRGARGDGLLVVHLRRAAADGPPGSAPTPGRARAGLVVPRSVGPAVSRNRVKRRLRHLLATRLADLSPGSDVVVRALPSAGSAGGPALARALDRALRSLGSGVGSGTAR